MKKFLALFLFFLLSIPTAHAQWAGGSFTSGSSAPNVSNAVGALPTANGGTSRVTLTANSLLYGNGAGAVGLLGMGSALQQIRVNAGGNALEYFTPLGGGVTSLGTPNSAVFGASGLQISGSTGDININLYQSVGGSSISGSTTTLGVTQIGVANAYTLAQACTLTLPTGTSNLYGKHTLIYLSKSVYTLTVVPNGTDKFYSSSGTSAPDGTALVLRYGQVLDLCWDGSGWIAGIATAEPLTTLSSVRRAVTHTPVDIGGVQVANTGAGTVTTAGTIGNATITTQGSCSAVTNPYVSGIVVGNGAGTNYNTGFATQTGLKPTMSFMVVPTTVTAVRYWIGCFSATPLTSATPAVDGLGFRFDDGNADAGWVCWAGNAGTSISTVASGVTVQAGHIYKFAIDCSVPTSIDYWISVDGASYVKVGTITGANIPAGTMRPWVEVSTQTTAAATIGVGAFKVDTD